MFIGTWWALIPPLLAIILAFVTKEVYSSLFLGVAVGAVLYSGFHPWESFVNFFVTKARMIARRGGINAHHVPINIEPSIIFYSPFLKLAVPRKERPHTQPLPSLRHLHLSTIV